MAFTIKETTSVIQRTSIILSYHCIPELFREVADIAEVGHLLQVFQLYQIPERKPHQLFPYTAQMMVGRDDHCCHREGRYRNTGMGQLTPCTLDLGLGQVGLQEIVWLVPLVLVGSCLDQLQ